MNQSKLPPGATLIGPILSSDKTNISVMTGNRQAHPLLISLANLRMDFRMKASNHAFLLLALLPIPKFLHPNKEIRGILGARLFHECIDFVIQPLKIAAQVGIMLDDALGYRRYCFTPLASCILDTPEMALYAGVAGKTSPVTMASYKQFGDSFRHEPRTASTTLAKIMAIEETVDPWDLPAYIAEMKKYRLNGVHRPFWRDWPLAEPSRFLTPELLHHSHKFFWDHEVKWSIRTVGDMEIDFRFSILHPHIGIRTFAEGISKLKQVTGREHRNVERFLICVIAGAVPKDFLIALRALMDYRYLCQAPEVSEDICTQATAALTQFHDKKVAVTNAGGRVGKKGIINHWYIPKLELMQSVVPNIRANGAAIQFTADVTERSHVEIKIPAREGNKQKYEAQICRHLDRADKCRRFELATSIRDANLDFRGVIDDINDSNGDDGGDDQDVVQLDRTSLLLRDVNPTSRLPGPCRVNRDFFAEAARLQNGEVPSAPHPFRTSAGPFTAFNLARDPTFKQMTVDEVATRFDLPDLREALTEFLHRLDQGVSVHPVGGRRVGGAWGALPFEKLNVWGKVRIQSTSFFNRDTVLPPQTAIALPPTKEWPGGRCDPILVCTECAMHWPWSGLQGGSPFVFGHLHLTNV
jgi:hypothetical protein